MQAVTWAARVTCLAPVAVLLVACGHPAQGEPPPSSPTPRPAAGVVAVLDAPLGALGNTVRVLREDGGLVSAAPLPDGSEAVALAGTRVLVAGSGRLWGLDAGAVLRDLGGLGDEPDTLTRGLVASPDGHHWMWASVSQDDSGTVHDTLRVAGDGMPPHALLTRTETGAALQPVAWTGAGVVVADEPLGIGGYVIFRREFGPTSLLDPVTATLRPLLGDDCAYSDTGPTGSTACVVDGHEGPHGDGPVTLHLISAGGGSLTRSLPGDIAQAGAAWFSPDGGRVTLASSPALATDSEVVHCMVLDTATARTAAGCPDGLIPAGWLAADSFAAFRTPSTGGGDPGTYVVHGDGTATRLTSGSQVVGTSSGTAG